MTAIVIDSGALLDVLLENGDAPVAFQGRLAGHDLVAPHIIDPEIVNATRKAVLRGVVPVDEADAVLSELAQTKIERFPHTALIDPAWRLRDNITAYDAMYVALAMSLRVPLVTADRRLARAAAQHCETIVLEG